MTILAEHPVRQLIPLSVQLAGILDNDLVAWLTGQPTAVRGVVDLAITEDNGAMVAAFASDHIEALDEIARSVQALHDEDLMYDSQWLDEWCECGEQGHVGDRAAVEVRCDGHRETVQTNAMLVASLLAVRS